jgi:CBS domain containing-hemolysin-like protein
MPGHELLRTFIDKRTNIAVVLDEYGGTAGVVSLEDVLEEMLGEEILDEFDTHSDMREYARRKAAKKIKDFTP